ncbi:hypothetical protein ACOSQ2_021556 [Xanthoceras sorbifolium]
MLPSLSSQSCRRPDMDRRKILLFLLLEMWHVEMIIVCTLVIHILRKRRNRRLMVRRKGRFYYLSRSETKICFLKNILENDVMCISEREMMENIGNDEGDDVNKDASPISINKESNYSRSNQGKRKRRSSSDDGALVSVLKELVKVSAKKMDIVAEAFNKGNEDRSDIAKELKDMGLSPFEQIRALKFILEKPQNISLFMSLDGKTKKVYVDSLLSENM